MNNLLLFAELFENTESIRSFLSQIGLWIAVIILFFFWWNERHYRKALFQKYEDLKDSFKRIENKYDELIATELQKKN